MTQHKCSVPCSKRRLLQVEGIALEEFSSTMTALLLLARWPLLPSLVVGLFAAVLVVALVQGVLLRRRSGAADEHPNLDCLTRGRFSADALRPRPEQDGETHLFGLLLVALLMPFIVGFLVIQLALLYVYPIGTVLLVALLVHADRALLVLAAMLVPIGLSILNELVVTRPLARRWQIPLELS